MSDIIFQGIALLLLIFFGSQMIMFMGLVLWVIWTDAIKPRLIPSTEIDRVAKGIITSYADPEFEAFARQERAWYHSDGAEQTYWWRVRQAVRRRLESR